MKRKSKLDASSLTSCVIYARVSSKKQVTEGHGLASQENRCREYAKLRGLRVANVYSDDISGQTSSREGMKEMLSFLNQTVRGSHAVIIDEISRLARSIEAHLKLRTEISLAGGVLLSPSHDFGEDPDSLLVENLLASVSQHHRQKNSETTYNRMRARMLNGYWTFRPPRGYRMERRRGYGKVMVVFPPEAAVMKEIFTGYANGRFSSLAEITRFLNSQEVFRSSKRKASFKQDHVKAILTNVLYTGYLERPDWNVPLIKANHEGIVTVELFRAVQDRMAGKRYAPARADLSEDFPLRGAVCCGTCNSTLTAAWSTSKTGQKHPYYLCRGKGCSDYGKSIRRADIEGRFDEVMRDLEAKPDTLALARTMIKQAWDAQAERAASETKLCKKNLDDVSRQIDRLLDQIVGAENERVIAAYEKRISKLALDQAHLEQTLAKKAVPSKSFEEVFELSMQLLARPYSIWKKSDFALRRAVLRLAFEEPIPYCRKNGFRTPKTTLPFKVLANSGYENTEMAAKRGIEPLG